MSELNAVRISPLLALVAEALDARNGSQANIGAALIELGQLARLQVPVRGVAPLSDDQLFNAIDSIAVKHLDLGAVRQGHRLGTDQSRALIVSRRH